MKKFSTPLPQPLPQECTKAMKIFRSFVTSGNNGLDKVIPHSVLQNAKGFVIFTVVKAGFVFSARAGSGLVIARLPDGSFSPPSAIGTAGMGFGGQAGAEITDYLIVLNSRSALRSFMSAGSLTLGGNLSLAVGPLGRTGEAMGALNTKGRVAAMYSYSKTKGLFGGVSVEGSIIVERQDANALAYGADVSAKQLLSGGFPVPHWADGFIETLKSTVGSAVPGWVEDGPMSPDGERTPASSTRGYSFTGIGSDGSLGNGNGSIGKHKKTMSLNPFSNNKKAERAQDDYFGAPPPSARSFGAESSRSAPPYSETAPATSKNGFDGFADDDDDPWGDSPNFRPATGSRPYPASYQPKPAPPTTSLFATHFESDFAPDAPAPKSTPSPFQPRSPGPVPKLTSSLNAFNFDLEAPKPVTPVTNPALVQRTGSQPQWSDNYKFRPSTQSPATPSYHSPSPNSGPSSISHSPVAGKPVRQLSVKKGLKDPAPPGATKAIALFDYSATEAGDLSFKEGDIIWVLEKTETTDDWWTGKVASNPTVRGVFPANFVSLEV